MTKEPDRNQRKALGRGLSSLLPLHSAAIPDLHAPHLVEAAAPERDLPESFEAFQNIPLQQISPGEEQPRSTFDTEKLMELAQSIRVHGVIQPITVRKVGPEKYKIIAGQRRWNAASLAGLTQIPALVRSAQQDQRLELALIENLQREDLNPIEIAAAFQRLASEHGLSHDEIAERTGKDRSTVTNFLRLLRLSPYVRHELVVGRISMGHGRALLNVADEKEQQVLCDRIIGRQLSVRATEQLVKDLTDSAAPAPRKPEEPALDPNIRAALEEMASALGTKVRLIPRAGGAGRLEIEYYSQDDLDRIYSAIVKQ